MINSFKAKYHNGQSSKGFDCIAEFHKDEIRLIVEEPENGSSTINWEIGKVKSAEHLSNSKSSIQYGEFPHQYVETSDPECIAMFRKQYLKDGIFTDLYYKAIKGNKNLIISACIAVCLTIGSVYFIVLPAIADYFASYLMAKEWEISMGENFYKTLVKEMETDTIKTKAANDFLKATGFETTYPVKITVIKKGIVNAFALPGGNIVIFDSLLKMIDSKDELAALIGHELTHVEHRHSTRMLCRSLAGYIFISIISGDVNGLSAVLVQNAHTVVNMKYTRSLEEEADKNGMSLMNNHHLNPKGMIELLNHLSKLDDSNREWYKFFLSHPLTQERITYCKNELKQYKPEVLESDVLIAAWECIKEK
jgi:Zn-dependent protease with chaperone function